MHRNKALRRYQTFVTDNWLGGVYGSSGVLGTKGGGSIAAAWAVLHHLGDDGYLRVTAAARRRASTGRRASATIPELVPARRAGRDAVGVRRRRRRPNSTSSPWPTRCGGAAGTSIGRALRRRCTARSASFTTARSTRSSAICEQASMRSSKLVDADRRAHTEPSNDGARSARVERNCCHREPSGRGGESGDRRDDSEVAIGLHVDEVVWIDVDATRLAPTSMCIQNTGNASIWTAWLRLRMPA